MEKLISIIVPIYKVENYLIRCIESIVCQTYENIEISRYDSLLCDMSDGSSWWNNDNNI